MKLGKQSCCLFGVASFAASVLIVSKAPASDPDGGLNSNNAFGVARTVSTVGSIDRTGPFFKNLGSNGRSCVSCHVPEEGWSITPEGVRARFASSHGTDPIFRRVDGSNTPNFHMIGVTAPASAFSMLMTKGDIRVERPIPPNAEFELTAVDDPYHYASASGLSLYRRPLPTTNLRFISTVMWDGREVNGTTPMTIANAPELNHQILVTSLLHQARDATSGHAEGHVDLTDSQAQGIVDFELALSTAQISDFKAGSLLAGGALGGPENIETFPFYIGINDNVADLKGQFNPIAMSLFDVWDGSTQRVQASIARGERIFNTKAIVISGVKGLNDNPYFGSPQSFTGSCTTCHNTPNVGDHSLAIALNIGIADGSRRTPDMPLYTLMNKLSGETVTTTDPGLALSTGKWKDIGRFKGPVLRALASRAPYFHNGSAKDLDAVLDFYADRFDLTFTKQERADLVAFLRSL